LSTANAALPSWLRSAFSRAPRHQFGAAFDAEDLGAVPGDWQGEVAETAEQVGDAFSRTRLEQAHGAPYQRAVECSVDLGELGRAEGHDQIEFGQAVAELGGEVRPEGAGAVESLLLLPYLNAMRIGKGAYLGRVIVGPGFEQAEYQNGDVFADGDFDLWDAVGIAELDDQLAQWFDQRRDIRGEHFATASCRR
jgi:hypothetical protein